MCEAGLSSGLLSDHEKYKLTLLAIPSVISRAAHTAGPEEGGKHGGGRRKEGGGGVQREGE